MSGAGTRKRPQQRGKNLDPRRSTAKQAGALSRAEERSGRLAVDYDKRVEEKQLKERALLSLEKARHRAVRDTEVGEALHGGNAESVGSLSTSTAAVSSTIEQQHQQPDESLSSALTRALEDQRSHHPLGFGTTVVSVKDSFYK